MFSVQTSIEINCGSKNFYPRTLNCNLWSISQKSFSKLRKTICPEFLQKLLLFFWCAHILSLGVFSLLKLEMRYFSFSFRQIIIPLNSICNLIWLKRTQSVLNQMHCLNVNNVCEILFSISSQFESKFSGLRAVLNFGANEVHICG